MDESSEIESPYNFAHLVNHEEDDENELKLPSLSMLEDQVIGKQNFSKSLIENSQEKKRRMTMITPKPKATQNYYPSPSKTGNKKFLFPE